MTLQRSSDEHEGRRPLGIYVHIPFCVRKCLYCDFVSYPTCADPNAEARMEEYCSGLCFEIAEKSKCYNNKYYVDTIFFGGGTPTLAPHESIISVLDAIRDGFAVTQDAEISIEANPGTVDRVKLNALAAAGFNRLSLGVQSFDDGVLKKLGRIHDSAGAVEAFRMVSETKGGCGWAFDRSMDLMFGVPGQTLEIWENTLKQALALRPEHLSFYSLQLEEGTPLYDSYRKGNTELPSWEENRSMYHMAVRMLKEAGYHHYEVSNAALPGHECRHNMKYWTMQEYLGFGTSAHSYIDCRRTGDDEPDPKGDFIFTELRLIDGFLLSDYEKLFGSSFEKDYKYALEELLSEGLLKNENGRVFFTEKGLDYTNPVMEKLLNNGL